uniref:LRRCT domain-containing protein n=1 Tax=Biomphalaria glabrata TaxID=6526 RepID=A0A2C9L3J2_BIOGL
MLQLHSYRCVTTLIRYATAPFRCYNFIHIDVLQLQLDMLQHFVETSLNDLDVSSNQLTSVPTAAMKRCNKQPTQLSLAHNQISSLSNSDIKDFTIETLDLSHNQISQIPRDLFQNVKISHINFSGNAIAKNKHTTIDDLSNTRLVSLPRTTETWLTTTSTKVNLNHTDWPCDCETLWLAELLTIQLNIVSPTCGVNTQILWTALVHCSKSDERRIKQIEKRRSRIVFIVKMKCMR